MTVAFAEPTFTSEDIVDAVIVEEPPSFEEAPQVASDTIGEVFQRVAKGLQKEACTTCGKLIAQRQMANHVATKHGSSATTEVTPKAPKPKDPNAKPTPRRVKADELLTTIIGAAAGLLVNSGVSAPTGMALALEAPLLGPEFDKAVAGTVVDKWAIQPLVKAKGRWEGVGNLAAFPILVFALDRKPELLPTLYPALRSSMKGILPGLVKAKRRQVEDERQMQAAAEELAEMDLELDMMRTEREFDPIDALIQSLFASKVAAQQAETVDEPGSAWDATAS